MRLAQVISAMEEIAPTRHAESWDNVGLLVGDAAQDVSGAMLTIDYTPEIACEAAGAKANVIVAYHPPLFEAVKRVTSGGATGLFFDAIRRGGADFSETPALDVSGAMLTTDYTPEIACEAAGAKAHVIVAYHPPLFEAVKRVTSGGATGLIFDAIRRGAAIYSPHTALDVAPGGTNDMLADILELRERAPLKLAHTKATQYKLVTFVPHDALERVSRALFEAGAARIGNYSACSFRSPGTGTFFGEEGTNPAVGQSG